MDLLRNTMFQIHGQNFRKADLSRQLAKGWDAFIGVSWLTTLGGGDSPWVLGTLIYKGVKLVRGGIVGRSRP